MKFHEHTQRTVPSPPRVTTRSTFVCRSKVSLSVINKNKCETNREKNQDNNLNESDTRKNYCTII